MVVVRRCRHIELCIDTAHDHRGRASMWAPRCALVMRGVGHNTRLPRDWHMSMKGLAPDALACIRCVGVLRTDAVHRCANVCAKAQTRARTGTSLAATHGVLVRVMREDGAGQGCVCVVGSWCAD